MNTWGRRENAVRRRALMRGKREAHKLGLDVRNVQLCDAGGHYEMLSASAQALVAETRAGELLREFSTGITFDRPKAK